MMLTNSNTINNWMLCILFRNNMVGQSVHFINRLVKFMTFFCLSINFFTNDYKLYSPNIP